MCVYMFTRLNSSVVFTRAQYCSYSSEALFERCLSAVQALFKRCSNAVQEHQNLIERCSIAAQEYRDLLEHCSNAAQKHRGLLGRCSNLTLEINGPNLLNLLERSSQHSTQTYNFADDGATNPNNENQNWLGGGAWKRRKRANRHMDGRQAPGSPPLRRDWTSSSRNVSPMYHSNWPSNRGLCLILSRSNFTYSRVGAATVDYSPIDA
jgi:hypothetical protein